MSFRKSQRHSLEGDFDTYFQTYFHEDYTIDNLSFITPEIMHALIEAKGYDIEIFEDKLYLYNEVENMPEQIVAMYKLGSRIRNKLQHNIITYKDERIASQISRSTVSVYGVRLRRAVGVHYLKLVVFVAVFLVSTGLALTHMLSGFAIYGVIIGAGGLVRELMNLREIMVDEGLRNRFKNIGA